MKITNKTKLPHIVEEWAAADTYNRGTAEFTTTELIKPPRILALERLHWDDIEIDVTKLSSRIAGQAKHFIFQMIAARDPTRYVAEERYTMAIAGTTISGQLDLYDKEDGTLYDYKDAKVWKKILGDGKEWTEQANINAFLCFNIGNYEVKRLINIVWFKDWTQRMALRDPKYPQYELVGWPLELWDKNRTLQFIQLRKDLHQKAMINGEAGLPLCTPEERWRRDAKWAVMKRGRKTAVKLFDSQVEAFSFIDESSDAKVLSVEERSAEDTRCLFYCDVAMFCDYGRKIKAGAPKP